VANAEAFAQANGSAWVVFHHLCGAHEPCGPYVVSSTKFADFLGFLQGESANGVVVKTMTSVVGGAVKGTCALVSGSGCDTSPR